MMSHKDFHTAIGAIAAGRYFSTQIDCSTQCDGDFRLEYACYIEKLGWSRTCATGEEAVERMRIMASNAPKPTIDNADPLPNV
jgi:hypothetical protein